MTTKMKPKVVSEDGQILVVEKPSGMVTTRVKTAKGKTLQDWAERKSEIRNSKFAIPSDFVRRAGIVHRLDKETSGLLVVAKTVEAFVSLQEQFKERKVKKKYLALVHGKVEPKEGEIRAPVGRLAGRGIRFGVKAGGKEAKTRYKILRYYDIKKSGKFSLVEIQPHTGRTHQIRIHLKYFGHPLVTDSKYAGKKRLRENKIWCPRLFLHAACLGFYHPKTEKWVEFDSDLPEDLEKALDKLDDYN